MKEVIASPDPKVRFGRESLSFSKVVEIPADRAHAVVVALVTQVASQASGTSAGQSTPGTVRPILQLTSMLVLFFSTKILAQVFPNNSRLVALFLAVFKVPCIAIAAAVVEVSKDSDFCGFAESDYPISERVRNA